MKKLNIALLHYSCPPVVGGVEEIVRQQASLFHRYFHNVKIFTGIGEQFTNEYPVEINPLLSSRNPKILRVHEQLKENKNPPAFKSLVEKIYEFLKRSLEDFDVLIAHNVLSMPFNLPLTYALLQFVDKGFVPVISWNHDSPYFYQDYPNYLDKEPWKVLKEANSNINYVVISESRKRQFSRLYGKKEGIHVIPNGVDPIKFFRLDMNTVRLIQEERLFSNDFLMVQPSRLHPRKNIELSIKVTRALRDKGIKARLLVTGAYDPHGPENREYYQKIFSLAKKLGIEKDVIILAEYKFKNGQTISPHRLFIRDLYLIADILFLPSIQEGFGIPLLESGMIKLPIVCSNIPPFKEIGKKDVCFFDLNDSPEEIADKIIKFISKSRPSRFFRRVIKEYVWDNIYESKLLPLIMQIVERR